MTKLHDLVQHGQSIWLDYIRRSFLKDGGLQQMVDDGVRGVTSNPTIFEKAITGSSDYDDDLQALVEADKSVDEIYETLAIADIQHAADILRPVYDESDATDGFVSLEVSPQLANDTDGTIAEARRLYQLVDRPNVMIKVPATKAGVPAIETLIGDGISINVTLIFSVTQYEAIALAYIRGLQKFADDGGDPSKVASVASFFVSRVESKVDKALDAISNTDLKGKIAIANAKVAYARFKTLFSGDDWNALAEQGAQVQRPLWASTGTKSPDYSDTVYVDHLIGPNTVNTVPPDTLKAFMDHGEVADTLELDVEEAHKQINQLAELQINFDVITANLQDEGVQKFAESFESLMVGIAQKKARLQAGKTRFEASLGDYQQAVDEGTAHLRDASIMHRIWDHDHTVWQDDPEEITNRLGWLRIMDTVKNDLDRITRLVDSVREDGYTNVLLLGMGGSSLAPEVFSNTFGKQDGYLDLAVLDSTDPGYVLEYDDKLDIAKTLFVVSTKSGGTAETLSFFKYFYNRTVKEVGKDKAGDHFIAITDPGSKLETLADQYHFRTTFLNDPNIGGRYSVLSFFGIVPAALLGIDVAKLLDRASTMAVNCASENCPSEGDNLGGILGAVMGKLAEVGRDKLTLIVSPPLENFGDWVEQLVAESTGKVGKGILPVVGEALAAPDLYGDDRLFVYLRLEGDDTYDAPIAALENAGYPVIRLQLDDLYDLGGQFFLWEMATVVSGHFLNIQPFDQPNVESAKIRAREMIAEYQEKGELPSLDAALSGDGITVYGDVSVETPQAAFKAFIDQAKSGDYISLQAYIHPTESADEALNALRLALREKTHLATTLGYGPRFLHSTGQLHKGDAGNGLFIQFTADTPRDADIPDTAGDAESGMTFGTLKEAQALGDRQALLDNDRRLIRFDLGANVTAALEALTNAL